MQAKKKSKKKKSAKSRVEAMQDETLVVAEKELHLLRQIIPKICTGGSPEERKQYHDESEGQFLLRLIEMEMDTYKQGYYRQSKFTTRLREQNRNLERVVLRQAIQITDLVSDRKEIRGHVREARGELQNLLGECGVTGLEMDTSDIESRSLRNDLRFIRKQAGKIDAELRAIDQQAGSPTSDEVDTIL